MRAKITEAVRIRLMSDVPLGAHLSGGIDSAIIVGLMAGMSDRPVKTFSIGFKEAAFNELEHARAVAEKFRTEHHEFIVEPARARSAAATRRAFRRTVRRRRGDPDLVSRADDPRST